MANTVLIGAQWGDEGKGKVIDLMTEQHAWIIRYQGGHNAGHTVEIGGERYVLHLLPSGILHEGKKCVIGHGVVVDMEALLTEIEDVTKRGISVEGRFFLSDRAHLIFPYHRFLDENREGKAVGRDRIGTTKRGIGPSYADKAARTGLRAGDIREADFPERLRRRVRDYNRQLKTLGATLVDEDELVREYVAAAERLAPYIADTLVLVNRAADAGEAILFEGAQGTMLDIDYGTYPYVTSSSATAGGACTGGGLAPNRIDRVIGVIKAYTTRVGEGPFPTELEGEEGEALRKAGNEFGATTGRPRRCGWFDNVIARYSAMVNGVDHWALTKLDVLDDVDTIQICVAYDCGGRIMDTVPGAVRDLEQCKPVYESFEGWKTSTTGVKRFEELPDRAQAYIARLEALTGVPVYLVSVGPGRERSLIREEVLKSHGRAV